MAIKVRCPSCDAAYSAPENMRGKKMKCSHCKTKFVVQEVPVAELVLEAVDDEEEPREEHEETPGEPGEEGISFPCCKCKNPLSAAASRGGGKMECSKCAAKNIIPPEPFWQIVSVLSETRDSFCDAIAKTYAKFDKVLGEAFVFEVGAYLLFRLDWAMHLCKFPAPLRENLFSLCEWKISLPELYWLTDSRTGQYAAAIENAQHFEQALVSTHGVLIKFLNLSPDDPSGLQDKGEGEPFCAMTTYTRLMIEASMVSYEMTLLAAFSNTLYALLTKGNDLLGLSRKKIDNILKRTAGPARELFDGYAGRQPV